jgi:hypothetical protein
VRHAILSADHAGAKASSDLSGGGADATSSADQQHRLPSLKACRIDATPSGHIN